MLDEEVEEEEQTKGKGKGRKRAAPEGDQPEDEDSSFSEASNPSELDFDEKDYMQLNFAKKAKKEGDEEEAKEETEATEGTNTLTSARLKAMTEGLAQGITSKRLKQFLMAFSSAVHLEEGDKEKKILIPSTATFQELMVFAFQELPILLKTFVSKPAAEGKKVVLDAEKLGKNENLLKNYVSNYIAFLGKLNDTAMVEFILTNSIPLAFFVLRLKPYHLKLVKLCVKLWSESENANVQLFAFILLREIAKQNQDTERNSEFFTLILKRCYKGYAENSRIMAWKNYDAVQFMRNCFVELMGMDTDMAYQQAFSQIRKLCLDLRTLIKQTLVPSL